MASYRTSTCETFYGDGTAVQEFTCEVRFQGAEIIVSYEDYNGPAIYRGVEEGAGHFRLTKDGGGGKGTLHRFDGDEVLEGYWIEDRAVGMWRVTLEE